MEPHTFETAGERYRVTFARTDEGWVARIDRASDGAVHHLAFPDGVGYAADDPRGSMIAGCEAAAARLPAPNPTRH
ncbi:hypothetical protein [Methylobacterium sp. A54F]